MGIKKEHLKILECYEYDDYTVKELKKILDIPENRIRLYKLELFEYYQIKTLNELKIKIRADKNWRKKIKKDVEIENKDRINYILINFLKKDVINLNDLSLILGVTRRTITKDLKQIKEILKDFGLDYISLNSKGIKILGNENNKKNLFNNILFIIFLERKYLPKIFNVVFEDFSNRIDKKIQKIVRILVKRKNVIEHTYLVLQIEILIYIGISRNENIFNFNSLKHETKLILEFCKKNRVDNLQISYSKEIYKVEEFVGYINKKTNFSIEIPDKGYVSLLSRFELIKFKTRFKIKEIYLMNRNFEKEYKETYSILINIVDEYFNYEIDSLDKISIFLILEKYLYLEKKIEEKIKGKNIIVYDVFQRLVLEEIWESLKLKGIEIENLVSEYTLETYLSENKIKNILLFESIDLSEFSKLTTNINIIRTSFPLGEIDYLKIKKMLK